jgi:hypothetical protein
LENERLVPKLYFGTSYASRSSRFATCYFPLPLWGEGQGEGE